MLDLFGGQNVDPQHLVCGITRRKGLPAAVPYARCVQTIGQRIFASPLLVLLEED